VYVVSNRGIATMHGLRYFVTMGASGVTAKERFNSGSQPAA
jgi:hypothetical protein